MGTAALQPAFVLHQRRFRNTSLLLDLFTQHDGLITVVARGAVSSRSNSAGLLQPFIPLLISHSGRGEVKTLNNVESAGTAFKLKAASLYCGFYINELLIKLTARHEPYAMLFASYMDTLKQLTEMHEPENCLRRFELALLKELGLQMQLEHEADSGHPIQADALYHYQIEIGPVRSFGEDSQVIRGQTLLKLSSGNDLAATEKIEARNLMRRVINHYLGGRQLKSRELFKEMS